MSVEELQFIDGRRRPGSGSTTHAVIDPSSDEVIAAFAEADSSEVDAAVQAARQAFPAWSDASPAERAPFDDEAEAVDLANDTVYGLAASAWTRDVALAMRMSRRLRADCVWINDHIPIVSEMPHGGVKQSGFGKDMYASSLEDYTIVKHVAIDATGESRKPWHRTVFAEGAH